MAKQIGNIANIYGCLFIKKDGNKYFWSISGHGGDYWEEITKSLYGELLKFKKEK